MSEAPCGPCAELQEGSRPEWTTADHPCFRAGLGPGPWMNRPRNPCLCGCAEAIATERG